MRWKAAIDGNWRTKVEHCEKTKVSEEKLTAANCARWEDVRDEKLN